MTVLLDTNILIDVLNNRWGRREQLAEWTRNNIELASCAITVAEIYAGMLPREARATAALFSELEYFDLTPAAAKRGGDIKATWAKKGRTFSLPDSLIAAVAIEHQLTLVTDNVKDFPMPGLHLLSLPRPD